MPDGMRIVALVAFALVCAERAAPQVSQAPVTVTLTGAVIDSITGEPLRRALVTLNGPEQRFALTDGTGRFQIEKVKTGEYFVIATKPGYFFRPEGQRLNVTAGVEPVTVKLLPTASISGRVLDPAAQPVEGVTLQVLTGQLVDGRRQWFPNQSGETDNDGNYEISNLNPGEYRLKLNQMRVPAFDLPMRHAGRVPTEVYPQQFYPNAADESGAQTIHLAPGARVHADFTVAAVPGFRVSGTVSSATGYANIALEDLTGTAIESVGTQGPRWRLDAVPAGSWKIKATDQAKRQYYAEQSIEVRGADLSNVNLVLQPVSEIPVRITGPDPGSGANFIQIVLNSPNSTHYSNPREGGSSVIETAPPGSYMVSVPGTGSNGCIDTVMSGATDLGRDNLVISSGATHAPIDITLRTDCASLTVNVDSGSNSQATVLLIANNRLLQPFLGGTGGTVHFGNLPPGEYVAYALSSIDDLEYANPEVMRAYPGQSITLAPNQQAELKIG
ncbi:MAG: carboxypeptidase regulatory-like domain-containing protein, partial [Acidobacteriaceae bacterium]|nr:carboxypeptidase regulatory-like domain-containing protein [Acidobacteriaceae bacterium]